MLLSRRALWVLFGAAVIVPDFVGSAVVVRDDSMNPRLKSGDIVLLDRFSVRVQPKLQRGAIMSHYSYESRHRLELARLIALSNEWVVVSDEQRVLVPPGSIWLEGAAVAGAEPIALLHSKAAWVIWPLNRFGPVAVDDNDISHRIRVSIWDR